MHTFYSHDTRNELVEFDQTEPDLNPFKVFPSRYNFPINKKLLASTYPIRARVSLDEYKGARSVVPFKYLKICLIAFK